MHKLVKLFGILLFFGNIVFELSLVPFFLRQVLEHFFLVLVAEPDFFNFAFQEGVVLFQSINVSGKLVHVVVE